MASVRLLHFWVHCRYSENTMVVDVSAGYEGERPRVAVSTPELLAPPPHTRITRTA